MTEPPRVPDLIKRLRTEGTQPLCLEAADALEAAERERKRLEWMVSQVAKAGLDAADIALATGQRHGGNDD